MRTILILCAVTLVVGRGLVWKRVRLPNQFGMFTGAPKTEVADLIDRPKDFLRKTVTIEGTVRQQCTTMGCFFFFSRGKKMLRVELQEIAMNAPSRKDVRLAWKVRLCRMTTGISFSPALSNSSEEDYE